MKISVSLPAADVEALDRYAKSAGLPSRSSAVHHAIQLLADPDLEREYQQAWDEWDAAGDAAAWDSAVGEGLSDAAR